MMKVNAQETSIAAQVAALPNLDMKALWALWDQYFPRRPGHHNRDYVEARVAYKIQEEVFGGLKPEVRKQFLQIGEANSKIKFRRQADIHIVPGTVLLRDFGEREHRVLALADGLYEYEGRRYKSLSAVARHITGTPWSGPLFFGLGKYQKGAK